MLKLRRTIVSSLATLPIVFTAVIGAPTAQAQTAAEDPLFLTATNDPTNYLVVIDTVTRQTTYVATGGIGGASGNAGGMAVDGRIAAVVNFGSSNVTIFVRRGGSMQPTQMIATSSQPVSVTFGNGHLVVLGQTSAQSFAVYGNKVETQADGEVQLLLGDGSAAQIVAFDGGVAYSEKTGSVAEVSLSSDGFPGLSPMNQPVTLPAAPNNVTPFALAGRGANVYLAIAHSDLETLIVNGQVASTASGPSPSANHAPCWNTLSGQFLYTSDAPGKQLLRFLVSDTNIFFDKPAIATFAGGPTDLAAKGNLLGVIDSGAGGVSNASLFNIDSEGELTLRFSVKISGAINGAAIID